MQTATSQRLIVEASIEGSVIRGTLMTETGAERRFHGWLEFYTAIESALWPSGDRSPPDRRQL